MLFYLLVIVNLAILLLISIVTSPYVAMVTGIGAAALLLFAVYIANKLREDE